ncbi:ArsR/SmtB family transcription factor [Acetobacter oeni]|uniref:Transcriptional regulator n=1 Tax=Acetobacter oeni TaxID=304077 RepID=A0A511XHF7_9PROT|nr:helix-turn-helix domain-containing protein [Acetobacter oeni]MBB3881221.1 DNA-binding transcriptional ArsR family regulator [Acetobacter oeni]NHO18096.1 metalloregulator ArsR/SmtB family transcription factor [Acetobacter oeni]GBR08317.1 ArsR family transcriptional regulator [Acetobacter oeni LMG 21952]GEN62372.1 transcriptional regulator [Acetobacter oeni]
MERYTHPSIDAVETCAVFHALSDPFRLDIVRTLARRGPLNCAALSCDRPRSTMSHHFRVLREAGLVRTATQGTEHINTLRQDELERRFPGLVALILGTTVPPELTETAS